MGAGAELLAASLWLSGLGLAGWVPLLAVITTTVEPDEASATVLPSGWLSNINVVCCWKSVFTCRWMQGLMVDVPGISALIKLTEALSVGQRTGQVLTDVSIKRLVERWAAFFKRLTAIKWAAES